MSMILANTPVWVFFLFFGLLALGVSLARDRVMTPLRAMGFPLAMTAFSLSSVLANFRPQWALALGLWLAGALLWCTLGGWLFRSRPATFDPATRSFIVRGSWAPLGVILLSFVLRYGIGVTLAMTPAAASDPVFVAIANFATGLPSGWFLAALIHRSVAMYRARSQPLQTALS